MTPAPRELGTSSSWSKRNGAPTKAPTSAYIDSVAAKIQALDRSEAADNLKHQLSVGRLVASVRENAEYGDAGVVVLARKLKRSPQSLYRLSNCAQAFPEDVIKAAIATSAANSYALKISVLDELLALKDNEDRNRYLQDAVTGRWPIKRVRAEIQRKQSAVVKPRASRQVLPRVLRHGEALMAALKALSSARTYETAEDYGRALSTLAELSGALNAATQRLAATTTTIPQAAE